MTKATISSSYALACAILALASPCCLHAQEESPDTTGEGDELEMISIDAERASDEDYDDEDVEELEDGPLTPAPTARQSSLEDLQRTFDLYREALVAGSFDEADVLAKRMVELAIRLYGLDSHESAKALTNLGLVQQKNREYDAAVLNFTSAIEIIERIEDRLNSGLVNPLRGLAAAQLGSGRPDLAKDSYDRAVHVTHVNEGPHNLMQIDILEELAETYLAMDKREEALDIHQFIYNLEARNTDLNSEDILPALERQAEWMDRMQMYEQERMVLRKIINIMEDSRGKDDLSLIPPLTSLGRSYLFVSDFDMDYYTDTSMASGDTYLKRALRIATENPESTWQTKTTALLALGDYFTLSSRATKAASSYEAAWVLLTEEDGDDEARLAERAASLETPAVLQDIHPPKYYQSDRTEDGQGPPDDFEVGRLVAKYRITERGSTRDIEIVEADPPGLHEIQYALEREMRRLIHRPRLVDGETVETPDQTYTHEFYYRLSDLPSENAEADDDETVAAGGS